MILDIRDICSYMYKLLLWVFKNRSEQCVHIKNQLCGIRSLIKVHNCYEILWMDIFKMFLARK